MALKINFLMKTAFIFTLFFSSQLLAHGGAIEMDILSGLPISAGKAAKLKIGIFTDEGHEIKKFTKSHGKLIHSMIISEDRRHFAHVHPIWNGSNSFDLKVNQQTVDFDNFQATRAFPRAGKYFFYSEVVPVNQMDPAITDYEISVKGRTRFSGKTNDDRISSKGTLSKYFRKGKRRSAKMIPGNYRRFDIKTTLNVKVMKMGGKNMLHFDFRLFKKSGFRKIRPITHRSLKNWLGMPGHAILVSDKHEDIFHMHYPHMNHKHKSENDGHSGHKVMAMQSPNSRVFTFMLELDDAKLAELMKKNISIWAQFRLKDKRGAFDADHNRKVRSSLKSRILTVPFRFNLRDALSKHGGPTHH